MEILKYKIIVIAILIFVMPKINGQEIDFKLGNIVYDESYPIHYGKAKKRLIERKYLEDKIMQDMSDGPDQKFYRQYLYDTEGNLSNKIAFNDQAALINSVVYQYSEKEEIMKSFDKNNNLVGKSVKTITPEMIKRFSYSIDEEGKAKMTSENRQYKDEYNNIIKTEKKNAGFNRVYVTETLFEYY